MDKQIPISHTLGRLCEVFQLLCRTFILFGMLRFIANNPTIDTIAVIQKLFPETKMNAVISLGCGFIPPKLSVMKHPSWAD